MQAIVFSKNWKPKDARKWMKVNNFKPIGRIIKSKGGNSKKYTIRKESDFKEPLGFKTIGKGISLILGTLT